MPIFFRNCSLKRSSCEIHPHLVDQVRYSRTTLAAWMWLPLLGLLAGHGEAQRCKPELRATNVARGRPAFQSSTYVNQFNSVARKAMDGNCSGRWIGQNSCTHTKRERESWCCGTITDTRLGAVSTIFRNGQVGRYITVPRTVSLALCEVEVYGTRV